MPTKETKSKKVEKVEKVEKETKGAVKKTSTSKTSAVKKETDKKVKTTTSAKKAATTTKKAEIKKETTDKKAKTATPAKKTTTKKAEAKKETVKKATTATVKKATERKTVTKKSTTSTTKKATKKSASKAKPKTATKKSTTTKKTSKSKLTPEKKIQILEYYDLPYRYNETTVKILAQTPNILFVYWDIADHDRANYTLDHGEYFFNDTYPVLIVHNLTKNYSTEVPINDFANSWYLHLEDANCEYNIELGRRYKEYATRNPDINIPQGNYIHVKDSNELVMPNDHVLFESLENGVQYRNVKNGYTYTKTVSEILLNDSMHQLKDFFELYKNIYQVDEINPFFFDLNNPGSGNPTSTFK